MAIPEHLAPQSGAPVMFENPLLERLSHISPVTVLAVFLPATIASFLISLARGSGLLATVAWFVAGAVFWTIFEYTFHRFVFHFKPATPFRRRLQFVMHGVHHQYPQDKSRLVMPVTVSVPTSLLMLWLFVTALGDGGWGFFCGFLAGYLAYDMLHYAVHHVKNPRYRWFRHIRQHHLAHHFRDTRRGFGVSSSFWDTVFCT